jgi:hypothetical protein
MKKYIFFIGLILTFMMGSCGSSSTTSEVTDTTGVQVDSNSLTGNDTTVAKIPTDNVVVETETK